MAENVWTWMEGQTGKVMRGQLLDDTGAVDLDQFDAVSVQVAGKTGEALLLDAECTPDPDQTEEVIEGGLSVSGKGWLTYTTDPESAAIPYRGAPYLLSFKAMDGTDPSYFPMNRRRERTYGRLVVQAPLG